MAFKRVDGEGEGSYSLVETSDPPGGGAGVHRHPGFQETFIVCDGQFRFEVDDVQYELGPGDVLVIPRGAWHGFVCTSADPGRLLTISTPAGVFEAGVAEVCAAKNRHRLADGGSRARAARDRGAPRHGIPLAPTRWTVVAAAQAGRPPTA